MHTGPKPAHDIGIWLGAGKPRMLYVPRVTAKTLSHERREGRWYGPAGERGGRAGGKVTNQIDGSARVRRTVSVVFADVTDSTELAELPTSVKEARKQLAAQAPWWWAGARDEVPVATEVPAGSGLGP